HEGAIEQPGMRQRELRRLQFHVVIGEKVNVDWTWSPTALLAAVASKRIFDSKGLGEKLMGRQPCLDRNTDIDERRLILHTPGGRAVGRRARDEPYAAPGTKARDRLIDCPACLTEVPPQPKE